MKRYWGVGTLVLCTIILLAQLVSYGQQGLSKFKSNYEDLIKNYRFSKAVKLCEDALKNPRIVRSTKTQTEIKVLLDDAQRQHQVFDWLIKEITGGEEGVKIDLGEVKFWVDEANEEYVEGPVENIPGSCYRKRWSELGPEVIYNLFDFNKLYETRKEYLFNLAIFCYDHALVDKADRILIRYYKCFPQAKESINQLISRKKNVPIPSGGFVVYHGQWVTPEEKSWLAKGYIRHEGKWMTYDQVMLAKGLVKYEGRWVTKEKAGRLKAARERLAFMRKRYAPKGVIDKPGADRENLPWSQHRTKEADHYIVKTNLTKDALNDIVYVMECLYYNYKKTFDVTKEPNDKLPVLVFRTKEEYYTHEGPPGTAGVFYWQGSKGKIMTYYDPRKGKGGNSSDSKKGRPSDTTSTLLHEGTHQFVHIMMRLDPPTWVNEGLATFYESSIFDGKELRTNLTNPGRLRRIKEMIKKNKYMPLKDFINMSRDRYRKHYYSQGWSLVYFLINGRNGRYERKFKKYWDELKKGKCTCKNPNPKVHIPMFERVFRIPLEDMEMEWKQYIMSLK